MQQNSQYNNWLRDTANNLKAELSQNMAKLPLALRVLESAISQEETTSVKFVRVSIAMEHLLTEVRLLVTLMEEER